MVKTPKSFTKSSSVNAPIAANTFAPPPAPKTSFNQVQVNTSFSTPEEVIQALTSILQRADPVTKDILSNTKVSEMEEIGSCINTIISGGKQLVAATQKKPSFFSSLLGRVKDNIESVKDQFKTMDAKFEEVKVTLDKAASTEKQNIDRMKKKLQILERNEEDLKAFIVDAEAYKDNKLIPSLEAFKNQNNNVLLSEAKNKLIILEQAIDDAKRYTVLCQQAMVQANESISTSYTAIYTVTVKSKSALIAFGDAAAQYISAKRTAFVNNLSNNLTDALEKQLQINAQQTKQNAIDAAKNASRAAVSIEVLENISKTLVESMEGVSQVYDEARQKRQADLPRVEALVEETNKAMRKW